MFNWKMAYAPNYLCKDSKISSIADIKKSGFEIINAEVPGNFELDLMREGRLCDLYYSTNTLKAQKLENMHVWYFSEFEVTDKNSYLHFEGIDTVSEIYINGSLVKKTDNMFIPYDVSADMIYAQLVYGYAKKNDILVCISTSGNSKNVVYAAKTAKMLGVKTLALTGKNESALSDICDVTIRVPETETYKVQELHLPVYHYLCAEVEAKFFK